MIERQPRITAINLVRVFVIALVISTHIAASNDLYNSHFSGVVWMISHTSRFLFLILTALVLIYNYGPSRPFDVKKFYLKRFTLVALPYATWTLIYQLRTGLQQHTMTDFVQVYVHNFVTAEAMYHLYFLLITMQLYLVFPLVRYLYGKVRRPWRLLWMSFVLQLLIMSAMHYFPNIPGLSGWLNDPDDLVWSYEFFIVCGLLIGTHLHEFRHFLLAHFRGVVVSAITTAVIGLILFEGQTMAGIPSYEAAAVFQPYTVIASAAYGLLVFALGFRWVERGQRFAKPVAAIAEDSFGIYLSHVFFLVWYAQTIQPDGSDFLRGFLILIIGLPLVYLTAFVFSEIARRTPLSVLLTGRHMAAWKKSQ